MALSSLLWVLYYANQRDVNKKKALKMAASAMTEAKQQVWEEFGKAMEKDLRLAPKCFWKTI